MATVQQLRQQAKARKVKGYSRMNKTQLMSALGVSAAKGDARAQATAKKAGVAKTFAADKLASKLSGGDAQKSAQIKQKVLERVKQFQNRAKKLAGDREISVQEKRRWAIQAIKSVAQETRKQQKAEAMQARGASRTEVLREKHGSVEEGARRKAGQMTARQRRKHEQLLDNLQERRTIDKSVRSKAEHRFFDLGTEPTVIERAQKKHNKKKLKKQIAALPAEKRREIRRAKQQELAREKEVREGWLEANKEGRSKKSPENDDRAHKKSLEKKSLRELYDEADRIGGKYSGAIVPTKSSAKEEAPGSRGGSRRTVEGYRDRRNKTTGLAAMDIAKKSMARASKHRVAIRDLQQKLEKTKSKKEKQKLQAQIDEQTRQAERHHARSVKMIGKSRELGYRDRGELMQRRSRQQEALEQTIDVQYPGKGSGNKAEIRRKLEQMGLPAHKRSVPISKLLGVKPGAKPEDVKRKYRALSRKYHPDANVGASPQQLERNRRKLELVQQAYQTYKKQLN